MYVDVDGLDLSKYGTLMSQVQVTPLLVSDATSESLWIFNDTATILDLMFVCKFHVIPLSNQVRFLTKAYLVIT